LRGMALAAQPGGELIWGGLEDLQAPRVEVRQGRRSLDYVDGRPPLGPRLGEHQGAGLEVEGGEAGLAGHLRPRGRPLQAAGDHEVENVV